jgi:uncharacterized protein (TIGR02147 family)
MKLKAVFEYRDYKEYLTVYVKTRPQAGHGEKSKIAEAIRVHNAYLSQILQGKADLSTEQAFALSGYLGFSSEETDFFLLLVQYARAGNADLKRHYLQKIEMMEMNRSVLKNRTRYDQKVLSRVDQATYFSSWYYAVIHLMITTMKGFQTLSALEAALSIPPKVLRDAILFLEKTGIIEKNGEEYSVGKVSIHLDKDATTVFSHHSNWRLQAFKSLENNDSNDLHYSSVVTVNADDFMKIRNLLTESMDKFNEAVDGSKHESVVGVLTMDWFSLFAKDRIK